MLVAIPLLAIVAVAVWKSALLHVIAMTNPRAARSLLLDLPTPSWGSPTATYQPLDALIKLRSTNIENSGEGMWPEGVPLFVLLRPWPRCYASPARPDPVRQPHTRDQVRAGSARAQ